MKISICFTSKWKLNHASLYEETYLKGFCLCFKRLTLLFQHDYFACHQRKKESKQPHRCQNMDSECGLKLVFLMEMLIETVD